ADSCVVSGRQLDSSLTRPSKVLATNSQTVGFQDHPLRQPFRDQPSLPGFGALKSPITTGFARNLRAAPQPSGPEIFSLGPFVSKSPHFAPQCTGIGGCV